MPGCQRQQWGTFYVVVMMPVTNWGYFVRNSMTELQDSVKESKNQLSANEAK